MKMKLLSLLLILTLSLGMLTACGPEAPAPGDNGGNGPDLPTVADAREAEVGETVEVTGVVAAITYAFGQVPSGIILVDDTGSIYIYGENLAGSVIKGDKITVSATKTYWILEDEAENAAKFGYRGCCQLENPTLLWRDGGYVYNKEWIAETTVKDIMDNPKENDITSRIFKVTALVRRVEGTGFTNYYIFDLDGETGSYAYTQCSGADFKWLDKFDGKICTVYLTALNAKSTNGECFYRLLPIEVIDEGFTFDTATTPAHVLKYYGLDQFESSYTADPALELIPSVSSSLLGFENATLTYTSSDSAVVSITAEGGVPVMHCVGDGTATVTVTATWQGHTESADVTVTVALDRTEYQFVRVEDAIAAELDEVVTVGGIVGPSLVNQDGFYLIDETGVIAVKATRDVISTLSIGNKVILTGKRDFWHKSGATSGQICLTGCEVVVNYYGTHDYSTETFTEGFTLADFYDLNVNDLSQVTRVYVLRATVNVVSTSYYTKIELTHEGTTVSLYCSGAGQYAWLQQFAGTEVTLELAPCNWNSKNYYTGCVLAVYTDDGKVLNQLNFEH